MDVVSSDVDQRHTQSNMKINEADFIVRKVKNEGDEAG